MVKKVLRSSQNRSPSRRHPSTSLQKNRGCNLRPCVVISETGRIQFWGVRFQMPNSVSFSGLIEFRGANSVSSFQPISCVCQSKLTEFLAELTQFAAELSEFSLPRQYSRKGGLRLKKGQGMLRLNGHLVFFVGGIRKLQVGRIKSCNFLDSLCHALTAAKWGKLFYLQSEHFDLQLSFFAYSC